MSKTSSPPFFAKKKFAKVEMKIKTKYIIWAGAGPGTGPRQPGSRLGDSDTNAFPPPFATIVNLLSGRFGPLFFFHPVDAGQRKIEDDWPPAPARILPRMLSVPPSATKIQVLVSLIGLPPPFATIAN